MFAPRVAKRYAKALFELAQDKNLLEDVSREMHDLQNALSNSSELLEFVVNPILTKEEKKLAIRRLFEKQINPFVFNFLLFLVEKRRLNMLKPICEVFDELYLDYKNIADVQIVSAFAVDPGQSEAILQKLRTKFHKDMRVQVSTDQSLIGGIKLCLQGVVYDFSFKTQLEKFRQSIV